MLYTEEINVIDGCRVLERARAYVVPAGIEAVLQYTFRNAQGQPVRLEDDDEVFALIREPLSRGSRTHNTSGKRSDPIFRIDCELIVEGTDPETYIEKVNATLPENLIDMPGIWSIEWAVASAGADRPNRIARSVLMIERSSWTRLPTELSSQSGPPTMNELRYAIQDSGRVDNVLLQRSEFSADQILMALVRPVQMWNECLPAVPFANYNTRNFPYREQWMQASAALLQQAAAANYLRNKTSEEGDLLNRDAAYDTMARRELESYQAFVRQRRFALSLESGFGEITSDYSGLNSQWGY